LTIDHRPLTIDQPYSNDRCGAGGPCRHVFSLPSWGQPRQAEDTAQRADPHTGSFIATCLQ